MTVAEIKDYVTVAQAAKTLGVDRRTILRYIRKGYLRAERVGRLYVIEKSHLTTFVKPKPGNPLLRRESRN